MFLDILLITEKGQTGNKDSGIACLVPPRINTPARNSNLKNHDFLRPFAGKARPASGILAPHRRGG
jgi:hypothetical protein